ncbi:hypothetical protein [Brenneria uluponensis]|uniref:hypothetical protein n=1 Tax=Brenneria uluponensis TaxID=3057057 RepID=UPI0028EC58C4|nr:hypothetical protein [Brenneria ulupoensis]
MSDLTYCNLGINEEMQNGWYFNKLSTIQGGFRSPSDADWIGHRQSSLFGTVSLIFKAKDEGKAIANDSLLGCDGSVSTQDIARGDVDRKISTGMVYITLDPMLPALHSAAALTA